MDVMIFAVICTSSDSKSAQNLANRARSRRASPVGDSPCHTWAWALGAWVGIDRCAPPPKVFPLRRGTSRNPLPSGTFREGRKRSEEHTSELQSRLHLVCRLLLEKKNQRGARSDMPLRTSAILLSCW